jgi:hypothetical protein
VRAAVRRYQTKEKHSLVEGCQIFIGTVHIPNLGKIYQITTKYTEWPFNWPNCHKVFQHLPLQGHPKFTQDWDFWFENKPSGSPALVHFLD